MPDPIRPPPATATRAGFTIALATSEPHMLSVTVVLVPDPTGPGFTADALVPVIRDWLAQDAALSTLRPLATRLAAATTALQTALQGVSGAGPSPTRKRDTDMAVADDLATLIAEMTDATTQMDGATAYIMTVPDLIAAAAAEAVANGATAEQIAPVTALGTTLAAKAAALTAAVAANAPAA